MTIRSQKRIRSFLALFLMTTGLTSRDRASAGNLFMVTRANSPYPHVGCVLQYDDGSFEWLHFRACNLKNIGVLSKVLKFQEVPGELVAEEFADSRINHVIGFRVSDLQLKKAKAAAEKKFGADAQYRLTANDCVSLGILVFQERELRTGKDRRLPAVLFNYVSIVNKNKNRFYKQKNCDRIEKYLPPWKREARELKTSDHDGSITDSNQ